MTQRSANRSAVRVRWELEEYTLNQNRDNDADVAGKKESFKKAGIEYTINQIDQYRACGVDGIHLYALNKHDDVAYIAKAAGLIDLV